MSKLQKTTLRSLWTRPIIHLHQLPIKPQGAKSNFDGQEGNSIKYWRFFRIKEKMLRCWEVEQLKESLQARWKERSTNSFTFRRCKLLADSDELLYTWTACTFEKCWCGWRYPTTQSWKFCVDRWVYKQPRTWRTSMHKKRLPKNCTYNSSTLGTRLQARQ